MTRQLDSINRMLAGIRSDLTEWEKLKDGMERASRRMSAMVDAMPGVRTILILDAQGTIIATNRKQLIGQNFRHREYFQAPLRNPDPDTLYVSAPYKTTNGIFSITLSRAIIGPDGRFAGVVTATLEPEEFRILMNSVRYAPDIQVTLVHGDGMVFMTVPEREGRAGMDMTAKPDSFFNSHVKNGQASCVVSGITPTTGDEYMMAQRTVQPAALRMNKPMVIAVSRDLPAIFADWRREAWRQGGLFGALLLISGGGLFAYQRRQRHYNLLAASHEAKQRKTAERLKLSRHALRYRMQRLGISSGSETDEDSDGPGPSKNDSR